jgi:hypothetical protein
LAKKCVSCGNSLLDFQRVCEKCGALQPEALQPTQKLPQASVRPQAGPEQAPPREVLKPRPPLPTSAGPPTGRRVRPLILASIVVVVVVVAVVAVALLTYNPFASLNNASTNGTSCTVTTIAGGCRIGNNLYLVNLLVSNSSFSNHATYVITFVINNTGTAPVNITTVNFDNGPVINGLPSSGYNGTSPFWVTYIGSHVIGSKSQLPFVLDVPRTTSSGAHKITLVDSAGQSYTFSFNI